MKVKKLQKEDIRKFQIEEGQIGIRLDRYYQNSGPCTGCKGEIIMEDIHPIHKEKTLKQESNTSISAKSI